MTMSSRRRAVRRARRVQVHFWRRGEPTPYVGYTTNISMTGMFIATNSPMPQGSRLRIEVVDQNRGFMVEGVVAHARKIRGDLARLNHSGMGVRFLTVEELVRELIPAAQGQTEEVPGLRPTPPRPPASPPEPAPPPAREPVWSPAPESPWAPEPPPPPVSETASPRPPVGASGGSFTVRFEGPNEFLEVFRRDIQQGGLFVSTLYPARLQESVVVEIHPPLPGSEPVLLRARVVQRFEPHPGESVPGVNLLAGMGLELLDLPTVIQKLQPIVDRLR